MLLILFSFSFAGLLLCHRCFTADRNCDEYPCTQNLAGNHSNCCVVALNHLTLGGRLPGQSRVEIPCTFSLSLCLRFTHTHVHARTHTDRWDYILMQTPFGSIQVEKGQKHTGKDGLWQAEPSIPHSFVCPDDFPVCEQSAIPPGLLNYQKNLYVLCNNDSHILFWKSQSSPPLRLETDFHVQIRCLNLTTDGSLVVSFVLFLCFLQQSSPQQIPANLRCYLHSEEKVTSEHLTSGKAIQLYKKVFWRLGNYVAPYCDEMPARVRQCLCFFK